MATKRKTVTTTRTNHALDQTVYGNEEGDFCLVDHEYGYEVPEKLGNLIRLGSYRDVLRSAVRGRSADEVADLVKVGRNTFRGYLYRNVRPSTMSPEGWRELVRLSLNPVEVEA